MLQNREIFIHSQSMIFKKYQMKSKVLLISVIFLFWVTVRGTSQSVSGSSIKLMGVSKIWEKAPHNAFTDLVRFKGRWFCVFREGEGHVSPDGALRIITSEDGIKWESAALITSDDSDLRDAKITITPYGKLMLSGAGAFHDKSNNTHQSFSWFSDDGFYWTRAYLIGDPDFWLWRSTWHNDKVYSIGYGCNKTRMLRLYSSDDGKMFDTLVDTLYNAGYPNETSIVFSGDTAYCLLRRDSEQSSGLLGISMPPYTEWTWKDLGVKIGGPHMIQLPGGEMIASVRLYQDESLKPVRTSICKVDTQAGSITELLTLPSGGDTSYSGLVYLDGILWVSYYSSHEGKTSIYLAKVRI